MKRQQSSKSKKYFVKEDDGIFSVTDEFFDDIESRQEALAIAIRTLGEIQSTLKEESFDEGSLFIGNMKVTTGLQRTLDELDRRWPFLITEMRIIPRRINGFVLNIC